MKMPFGKYKGEEVSDIPLDYLKWVEENVSLTPDLRSEINFEVKRSEGSVTSMGRERKKITFK